MKMNYILVRGGDVFRVKNGKEIKLDFNDYADEKLIKKSYDDSFAIAESVGSYKTDGKKISEIFCYKQIPLWHVQNTNFYLYYLCDIITDVNIIKKILISEKPSKIIVEGKGSIGPLAIEVAKSLKISVQGSYTAGKITYGQLKASLKDLKDDAKVFGNLKFRLRGGIRGKEGNKIVFLNRRYSNINIPVIKELEKKKGNNISVIQFSASGIEELKENCIPFKRFEGYFPIRANRKAKNQIREETLNLFRDNKIRKLFNYDNINLWNIVDSYLFYTFFFMFVFITKIIDAAYNLIETENPSIMIANDTCSPYCKVFFEVAKIKNIPTLMIEGFVMDDGPECTVLVADKKTANNAQDKKILIRGGIDGDRVVLTGQPRYEYLLRKYNNVSRNGVLNSYSLNPDMKIAVFTSMPLNYCMLYKEKELFIKSVFNAVQKLESVQLLVVLHPTETDTIAADILKSSNYKNIKIVKGVSIYPLIKACDLLITKQSTTGIEAILFDKPLVCISLGGITDPAGYVKSGAALGVFKPEDAEPAIRRALTDKKVRVRLKIKRQEFMEKHNYNKNDGKSSERVAAIIEKMVKGR